MFARVELYSDRYRRRGLRKIADAVLQVSVVSLLFALASGRHFSSYYLVYGSLVFATPCCPQSDATRLPQGAEALVQIVALDLDTTMSDTSGRGRQGFTLRTVIEPP